MRLIRQAVFGQILTYAAFLALALTLPQILPAIAPALHLPTEPPIGECTLLAICFVGLKLQLVYTLVPLAGYQ